MIVSPDFENRWITDHPIDVYHADKSAVSSSALRQILKSPAAFYQAHYLRDETPDKVTKAKTLGSLVHMALLEGPKFLENFIVMPDLGDMRSSKNREARDVWLAENQTKVVVKQDELDVIKGTIDSVIAHPDARHLLKNGVSEISGYYRDPETGIALRIRPDFFSPELMAFVDIKTTKDCAVNEFAKSIWNYRYDFQVGMYAEGIEQITGKKVDYVAFVAIEKEPPYEVAVYIADDAMLNKGRADYRKALKIFHDCLLKNEFPMYQQKIQTISLPAWAFND